MLRVTLLLVAILLFFTFGYGKQLSENYNKITSKTTENLNEISSKYLHQNDARWFKIKAIKLVPMLIGGLLKLLAMIPVILISAILIGTVSLIGSKISLLISLILGIKTLLSMLPSHKKSPKMMDEDDLNDLQQLITKYTTLTSSKNEPMTYPNHYGFSGKYMQYPEENLYYANRYYIPVQNVLPGNVVNNQPVNENIVQVPAPNVIQDSENGHDGIFYFDNKLNEDRLKILAAADMAAKANSLLEKQSAINPNRRVGVKITKTVVNHSS